MIGEVSKKLRPHQNYHLSLPSHLFGLTHKKGRHRSHSHLIAFQNLGPVHIMLAWFQQIFKINQKTVITSINLKAAIIQMIKNNSLHNN